MIFRLALKNILSRKSSAVIVAFIAFSVMLLVVCNAVFDSTEQGVQRTYTNSFTGDLFIRPTSDVPLSLFGDETPVTGSLTAIPLLIPYEKVLQTVTGRSAVTSAFGQLTCPVLMESTTNRIPIFLFGVEGKKYAKQMSAIHILEGAPFANESRGIMLSKTTASALGVGVGDEVQCAVSDGISFRIRSFPVSALYDYELHNSVLERIAIADFDTVLSLLDITWTEQESDWESDELSLLLDADFSDDSLFLGEDSSDSVFLDDFADSASGAITSENELFSADDNFDTTDAALSMANGEPSTSFAEPSSAATEASQTTTEPSTALSDSMLTLTEPSTNSAWNFIVCKLNNPHRVGREIRLLNREFKKSGWQVNAAGWRSAAGSTAIYLYWIRIILNIGIIIILIAGCIIVNNTLVVNVLERIKEFGTMRAIGATRRFVSIECMAETLLLSVAAGILGVLLGSFCIFILNVAKISFTNDFLVQLFGSNVLNLLLTARTAFLGFALSIFLGAVAWIYPVKSALSVQPSLAMQGGT